MPKKFSLAEKKKWLDLYESGRSELWIAKNEADCDARTVKKGIDEARQERRASMAEVDLLKNALRNHQDTLLNAMKQRLSSLKLPPVDMVIVPSEDNTVAYDESETIWELLHEHLKRDPIWVYLAKLDKAYSSHIESRIAFKEKVTSLLKEKTGFDVLENPKDPPFIYSYTAAEIFYKEGLRRVLGISDNTDFESEIQADEVAGAVKYRNSVFAECPGAEQKCAEDIRNAYRELLKSVEAQNLTSTYTELKEFMIKAKRALEEVLLLEMIPGHCRVCRRLGLQ